MYDARFSYDFQPSVQVTRNMTVTYLYELLYEPPGRS